jgi:hypothetical protein
MKERAVGFNTAERVVRVPALGPYAAPANAAGTIGPQER